MGVNFHYFIGFGMFIITGVYISRFNKRIGTGSYEGR